MASRHRLAEYLDRVKPERVGELELREIKALLAPVSEATLRRLLRESGWPLDAVTEGVAQDSLDNLERTLLALQREYERGDSARKRSCRDAVILAKNHARWRRAEKEEMMLWMRTWLENPPVFPLWLELRKRI